MKPVQCPACSLQWNIPDDAGRSITCPRCLAALNNPYFVSATPPPMPTGVKPPPLPVIPIDRQVHRDHQSSTAGLIIIVIVIVVGVLAFFISVGQGASISVQSVIGLIVLAAAALIPIIAVARKPATVSPAIASTNFRAPQAGDVLDYQRPLPDPRKLSGGAFFAQAIGGIILGIVGGAFLTGAFASVANGAFTMLGLGAPVVIGAILCTKPRVRGLGVGLILALPAAFLLLLGFCAIIIAGGKFH